MQKSKESARDLKIQKWIEANYIRCALPNELDFGNSQVVRYFPVKKLNSNRSNEVI